MGKKVISSPGILIVYNIETVSFSILTVVSVYCSAFFLLLYNVHLLKYFSFCYFGVKFKCFDVAVRL